jgi:hypothetical protein
LTVSPVNLRKDLPDDTGNQFDQFAPIHLARPVLDGAESPAPESQFRERIQADWDFRSSSKKYLFPKIGFLVSRLDKRGGSRSSRNAGRDAMDAEVPLTSGAKADGQGVWS